MPRKYSKSFTGCWTCRNRKIKCDETKPKCGQCRCKDLACGYGVKLQWIRNVDDPVDEENLSQTRLQRCQIKPDSKRPIIPTNKIIEILDTLDAMDTGDIASLANGISHHVGSFGVFSVKKTSSDIVHEAPKNATSDSGSLDSNLDEAIQFSPSQIWDFSTPCSLMGEGEELMLNGELLGNFAGEIPTEYYDSKTPSDVLVAKPTDSTEMTIFSGERRASYSSGPEIVSTPPHMSNQESFLMHYYAHQIAPSLPLIDNAKNPWKVVHLPIALQSVGELKVQGTTSRIRRALKSSLLSISAFSIAIENKIQQQDEESMKWSETATTHRTKGIRLLKDSVKVDFYYESRPKYKEFLASMLSMVVASAITGDIADCEIHLNGSFHIMNEARTWKHNYSTKAKSLHHIYFYLRTIYESTAPRDSQYTWRTYSPTQKGPNHVTQHDTFCQDLALEETPESSLNLTSAAAGMGSYECMYGIPHSLLVLLMRALELINKLYDENMKKPSPIIPDHLISECDELERNIMDWSLETELNHFLPTWFCEKSDLIHHQTRAFHNALIIYFAQHVRLVGHRFLQPYIKTVLESARAVIQSKADAPTPLYWPVFIAASEAFDDELQKQFKSWYAQAERYEIAKARTGITVLEEVWKTGPASGNRTTCYWRAVAEQSNHRLFLC